MHIPLYVKNILLDSTWHMRRNPYRLQLQRVDQFTGPEGRTDVLFESPRLGGCSGQRVTRAQNLTAHMQAGAGNT